MLNDRWMMACVLGFLGLVLVMMTTTFPENIGIQIYDDKPSDPLLIIVILAAMPFSNLMLLRRNWLLMRANRRLAKAEANAQIAARVDPLTGLSNRRKFHEELDRLNRLDHCRPFALLLIDLDYFKPINDAYGHAAGDEVLLETANRLKLVVPQNALCARMGGDEFAVIMTARYGSDIQKQAADLGSAICGVLSQPIDLTDPAGESVQIFASIGIVPSLGPASATELLRLADEALYRRKDNGRDGWWIAASPKPMAARRVNRDALHRRGS